MRRAFACLLAAGLVAAAGPALAQGFGASERGYGRHDAYAHRHGLQRFDHRPDFHGRRHGFADERFGRHHIGQGLPLGVFPRAYVLGEPRSATTIIETRERLVEPREPTIPTSVGIRAAPVGQPTLYVLNEPPRRLGLSATGRRGPRIVELDRVQGVTGEGPRVVHLQVPRDRPRRPAR
jgi:hypothetical protein